jgi:dTDP-glucose pyrophosphorylase
MIDWKTLIVGPSATLHDTMQVIDKAGEQTALVVDDNLKLLGIISDGDVRRAVLRGASLQSPAVEIMNRQPKTLRQGAGREAALALMRTHVLRHLPVIDVDGRVVGLEMMSEFLGTRWRENRVLLMAGGMGRRLQPMTSDTPKPMLDVGGQPILEIILRNFVSQGFRRFYISVHYKAETIIDYFADGSRFNAEIEYVREPKPLGTAGALSLLPEVPNLPIVVMNGDILTNTDFSKLVDFHVDRDSQATMCVREYDLQVPYGVVKNDGHLFAGITEKPTQRFFVNAGIYSLSPAAIARVRPSEALNMTDLFERVRESGERACVLPIQEYWLDVGRSEDFDRANFEYPQVFK